MVRAKPNRDLIGVAIADKFRRKGGSLFLVSLCTFLCTNLYKRPGLILKTVLIINPTGLIFK